MTESLLTIGGATLLLACGLWLMLPRGASVGRSSGLLLVTISLGLFASLAPRLGEWAAQSLFLILAGVTVLAAVATVTFRNPVYSAIWFGLSLLGTASLFLFQGAQFLGVATVVVYAGAILVTFLFVLMLAQPKGQAYYDRLSWGAPLSALTGALVVGVLTLAVTSAFQNPHLPGRAVTPELRTHVREARTWHPVAQHTAEQAGSDTPAGEHGPPYDAAALDGEILAGEHVARLGAQLFSKYLVAVEVAGTLLLVALVGTVAIVAQIRRPEGLGERTHG
jgi:NADH-quinone oxidoreductase subunit J